MSRISVQTSLTYPLRHLDKSTPLTNLRHVSPRRRTFIVVTLVSIPYTLIQVVFALCRGTMPPSIWSIIFGLTLTFSRDNPPRHLNIRIVVLTWLVWCSLHGEMWGLWNAFLLCVLSHCCCANVVLLTCDSAIILLLFFFFLRYCLLATILQRYSWWRWC